ncbi:MAG: hypothetical protein DPW09_38005 [Anaerolineae bacterium]|nr:ParB N-terminal domain-containing protein [Anaerolineae bacterium]MCQ3979251.1 hypothetical protein [Anaerolineae bacterium]
MSIPIEFVEIPASKVMYDHDTQLFPFSPRRAINQSLVERLKRSITETGLWQPILVRTQTLEGVAGNHRYLAYLEFATEFGVELERLMIPAALVDCDEELAVAIALIEDELRENLTQPETLQAILKAAERKPSVIETIFDIDGATIEQLRFWEQALDTEREAQERQRASQTRLTRQWIQLINSQLAEYPELHSQFIRQLRNPAWVQARTLDDLQRDITRALIGHGIRFEAGKTWNSVPTFSKCFRRQINFKDLREELGQAKSEFSPQADGTLAAFCPYLRLFPHYTQQFIPSPAGSITLPASDSDDLERYPPETVIPERLEAQGDYMPLLDQIEAFCIAPDVREANSCFHQQEAIARQATVEALQQKGLPVALTDFVKEREKQGEFIWLQPQIESKFCTPQSCLHTTDDPPGYVVIAQPGDKWQMVCIHATCGGKAKEALIDWGTEQRRLEQQRHQTALNHLRRVAIERTLLAPAGEGIDLSMPSLLRTIEILLVQDWDSLSMFHIITGWQQAVRGQLVHELGLVDPMSREVTRVLQDRFGELAEKPKTDTIGKLFVLLRESLVHSPEELSRWIACLALVRSWRDEVNTIEQIEDTHQKITHYDAKADMRNDIGYQR